MTLYVLDPSSKLKTQFNNKNIKDVAFFNKFKDIEFKLKFKDFILVNVDEPEAFDGFDPELVKNKDIIVFSNDEGNTYSLTNNIDFKKLNEIIDGNTLVFKNDLTHQDSTDNTNLLQQLKGRVKGTFTNNIRKNKFIDDRSKSKVMTNKFFNNTLFSHLVYSKQLDVLVSKSETQWAHDITEDYVTHLISINKIDEPEKAKLESTETAEAINILTYLIKERGINLDLNNVSETSEPEIHNDESKKETAETKNETVTQSVNDGYNDFSENEDVNQKNENKKIDEEVEQDEQKIDEIISNDNDVNEDQFAFNDEEEVDSSTKEEKENIVLEDDSDNAVEIDQDEAKEIKEEEKPTSLDEELKIFEKSDFGNIEKKVEKKEDLNSFNKLFDELNG